MARTSIFRLGSAFNAALLTCIILKHISLALVRSAARHVCMVFLMPIMILHDETFSPPFTAFAAYSRAMEYGMGQIPPGRGIVAGISSAVSL
ncbi:uncharacterized protein LY79DRAFT_673766 [Colletotrichum navitas]|uniref:Uncharacterized protein n=1 Tax=Colletotrichum navitas TaxID=681940 RepID=A0AAD8UZ44_9PEZI|nr:uncharacterized protein LY79DRAFT_673766 [Colletotrichum navitas]KAK1573252.1 hypothetical protein LY79DRAFT_673766 [Colletotrichum navitas]